MCCELTVSQHAVGTNREDRVRVIQVSDNFEHLRCGTAANLRATLVKDAKVANPTSTVNALTFQLIMQMDGPPMMRQFVSRSRDVM